MLTTASWVFALLLTVAGAQKVTGPAATRVLGVGEVGLGLAVLIRGGRAPALALALAYAVFAGVAESRRRRGTGCGCFGTDTLVTPLHVWLDVAAAGVAAGAAAWPSASLAATVAGDPLAGALTVVLLVVAATLLRLVLTEAAELTTAVARTAPRSGA
jgi:hypothetical protein